MAQSKLWRILLDSILWLLTAIETAGPEVLSVKKLDLKIRKNTQAHHTDEFDITDRLLSPNKEENLVVRRGQPFEISLEFNRPYNREEDDLRLVFTFGKLRCTY